VNRTRTVTEIRNSMRVLKRDMHTKGIKRVSCFNGGLAAEAYTLNAKMFALETELKAAEKLELETYSQASELDADQYDSEFRRGNRILNWKRGDPPIREGN
jgi:hypothetical protein